jgi:hypothetical protein
MAQWIGTIARSPSSSSIINAVIIVAHSLQCVFQFLGKSGENGEHPRHDDDDDSMPRHLRDGQASHLDLSQMNRRT